MILDISGGASFAVIRLRLEDESTGDIVPAPFQPALPRGHTNASTGGNERYAESTGLTAGFVMKPDTRLIADVPGG